MAKTRQPIRPLSQTPAEVAANAAAEKARKTASKKALREAIATAKATPEAAKTDEQILADVDAIGAAREAHRIECLAGEVFALTIDAEAMNPAFVGPACPTLTPPDDEPEAAKPAKQAYDGPMIALKTARLHYVKAQNGIPCNGDALAQICGMHTREHTVRALILALGLPGNPYLKLNPGQQSMNLRNKARHQIANGTLSYSAISAAYAATTEAA